jgi:putative ABC transport system permease protein
MSDSETLVSLNGLTTSTMSFQMFSSLAFGFKVTPDLLARSIIFALAMGIVGGLLSAIRAANTPVSTAL